MAGFSEDTRVKIPALMHLTRIGYTYRSLHSLHLDPETNIDTDTFTKKIKEFNPSLSDSEIELFIGKIRVMLGNEDLGREFYEKILSNKTYKIIDYDNPKDNIWECVTEMPCENGGESFRPDITLLINGLPLVFIEVKMPNNHGGMLQEYHRMNDTRFPNTKFRRFLNLTQLMIFSDNKHYDFTTQVPVQGAFYGCRAEKQMVFNVFREESSDFIREYPYKPLKEEVENFILKDTNYPTIISSPEYKTNKEYDTPTNSIITSLCSHERLLYLLRFGFVYLDYIDTDTQKHVLQKHVMRYPQLFGTQAIRKRLSDGVKSGIIWHTQGSGKTALSYFATRVLTDYYKRKNIVPKFYFFVDRLDLMEQATNEFSNRGLKVINVETRDELMATFETTTAQESNTGQSEIIVVNIQKLKDNDGKVKVQQYAVNIQRIYFLDEAHRDYNPQGSFLARLFESDPNAIRLALTGTPLIGEENKSRDVFGEYISTYYYNRSIEDGFTKKILREDIETSYRLRLQEVWHHLEETVKVKKEDVRREELLENPRYVESLLDYIIEDFKLWRIQQGDPTLAGMIVCETNPQAREMFKQLQERENCGVTAELILHDFYDKEIRKGIYEDFKKHGHPDILIVNNMLLTGFDAHRLKRLYLGRKLKDHNLLQALTRVNRPYKQMQYGYVVDFADIQQNFNEINDAYAQELNQFSTPEQGQQSIANTVLVSEKEIKEKMLEVKEVLFDYTTDNAEIFAQELEEIDDRDKLLQIRNKLENAKALWNEVRTFGTDDLKELTQRLQPGDVQNLLKAVKARIDNVNLKNVFNHEAEVSGMINEALATIDFKFRKRGENEMEIGSDIKDEMKTKRQLLSQEMMECIDQDDEEYISLTKIIQEHFAKKKFEIGSMADAKEEIGFMDMCMERIKKINRENANLQAKYRGDSKYVRAHKRIRKYEKDYDKTVLSEKEVQQCEALNRIKDAIDLLISNRKELILNEPDFNAQVVGAVAQSLRDIDLKANPDDRRFVARLLTGEYLREFNVVK
jgi:type I restriction enzyme R subunit